jgi:hypothetical protein
MDQVNQPNPGKLTRAVIAATVIIFGSIGIGRAALTRPIPATATGGVRHIDFNLPSHAVQLAAEPETEPEPADAAPDDEKDVPTSQVDKYISVYEAMQKDHNLTVEQAASKQGLTVAQFRSLENKIENDDTLRERVRKALRHAANPKDTDSSDD